MRGVGYANLVLSKEECLQEETLRESNKKQEEDPAPGMQRSRCPGGARQDCQNINDEH